MNELTQYEVPCTNCPLELGTVLRTPAFAWGVWGVTWHSNNEFDRLLWLSETAYRKEWEGTTEGAHEAIRMAAEEAGLGSANQELNQEVAQIGAAVLDGMSQDQLRILDVGAGTGSTSLALWDMLPGQVRRRTRWTLVDPAQEGLRVAERRLRSVGMEGSQLVLDQRRDIESLAACIEEYDLVVSTAALHHHAEIDGVLAGIARALKRGGCVVVGDWHNHLSTHPAAVRGLLERLQWPEKKNFMKMFEERFAAAKEAAQFGVCMEEDQANEQIERFWMRYAERAHGGDRFRVLEGHRPVCHYVEGLKASGMAVPMVLNDGLRPNPYPVLRGSNLLCVVLGQRPVEGPD